MFVDIDSEIQTKFEELQKEMKKLDSDFQLLSKIGGLVASLHDTYEVIMTIYDVIMMSL